MAASSKSWEEVFMKDMQVHIDEKGLLGIEELFKEKLEGWKEVEINIGITGDNGAGKSSFINIIRGLGDEDDNAAEVGVVETTIEVTAYRHPTNEKIIFWDLPGVGSPNYPNLETYCKDIKMENFDFFLIFSKQQFTENDRLLAEKVKSLNKPFFFIRTYIDIDYLNASRKSSFNEQAMLQKIKRNCLKNLKNLETRPDEVFLISNYEPGKWDFGRLTQAILDALPYRQRECLAFSLGSWSTETLKEKVNLLRGRIWMIATASAAAAVVPLPGLNILVDFALLKRELSFYKSQLGLPDENSDEFQRMTPENQQSVRMFCNGLQMASLISCYAAGSAVEEFARFIPLIGLAIAGGISFASTYNFLHECLKKLESAALDYVSKMAANTAD